ncbi:tRNA glutamyl-Q(34) synthetase GluQRS [Uliginosibacterium sp. H3]|uniref:Glutamyl-Q tRNA(Asp) synthetase n=1 Tax=Uliginosibacterium silvisoli TaxID=3114758 RepID=A0ABU6K3N7_9RHOO|nr:tRNA glutamyl-Q(34) synthetase GluQRS [Uliginosibacterium sp. H3]
MTSDQIPYIGRFAPSPSGALHFGSLVAALGSFLEARTRAGRWLLRMEDIDAPRTVPGAAEKILAQLEAFGFAWDGPVVVQSQRLERYREVLDYLVARGQVFPCSCSRKEMADSDLARDGSRRYPGTCRHGLLPGRAPRAWRFLTSIGELGWLDAVQGAQSEDVARDVGDFVLLRADGQFAYQLAVVVDDAEQGVTHIVRGADLLDSTGRQIALQRALGYATPQYAHLPVATNAQGEKLSKQTLAQALDVAQPVLPLWQALGFLGQAPPDELKGGALSDLWAWAHANWSLARVPRQRAAIASGVEA